MNIPLGYHTITPYFTVADAEKLMTFVTHVFGGTVIKEARYPNGKIQHARMQIGDSIFMLNEQTEDYRANKSQMHIYVSDLEAVYLLALNAGAKSIMEPNTRPHGDQMAGIEDVCGNIWWITQPKS